MKRQVALGDVITPRVQKIMPSDSPDSKFIGLEHVQSDTGELLGTAPAYKMKSSAAVVRRGDVIYGRLRPYLNKVHLASEDYLASGEFIVFPGVPDVSPRFLVHLLRSPDFLAFTALLDTGDRPRVNWNGIKKYKFELPSLAVQQHMVNSLEDQLRKLDKAFAKLHAAQAKLASARSSVLDKAIFSDTAPLTSLGSLGQWITGATPPTENKDYLGQDVPFVTPGDIQSGGPIVETKRFISNAGADVVRRVPHPSIQLVCIGATLGKVGISSQMVTTNQQINSLVPDDSVVDAEFANWMLASPRVQRLLWGSSSSTTVPILNKGSLQKIEVPLIDKPGQRDALDHIKKHLSCLEVIEQECVASKKKVDELRRSILHSTFSGKPTSENQNG